jgi:DNA-directed RNA polymerase specialized sigma24 family protein
MSERESLEQIERLLALNLIDGKESNQAVKLLYRAGYSSSEIGEFLGMNPSTVRGRISTLKDEGEIDD